MEDHIPELGILQAVPAKDGAAQYGGDLGCMTRPRLSTEACSVPAEARSFAAGIS